MFERIDPIYLNNSTIDFISNSTSDLIERWSEHKNWCDGRLANGIESYAKATSAMIGAECRGEDRAGRTISGVNFGSQEYLNLASDPRVHEAAKAAIDAYGVHSAGSAALMGNTRLSLQLEERLAAFLGYEDCTVFPTGWGAGYGIIKTLVRPSDHVVIDKLAHACLHEGARSATQNVHTVPHLSNEAVRRRLERLRGADAQAGILVVTETLFSMNSDVPDIRDLQKLCRDHNATLLVDAAHDLGSIGPTGRGFLELQEMVGRPDLLMGSFSKTFASNGGFVAANNTSLKLALRYNCGPLTFTNALSPVQCAIVLRCIEIVDSPEGAERRGRLMENAVYLRACLQQAEFKVLGQPSAIVPTVLGSDAVSRLMTRYTLEAGGIVNLVEYPAVARNTSRWRLQVMARHERRQIDRLVEIAMSARTKARAHLAALEDRQVAE